MCVCERALSHTQTIFIFTCLAENRWFHLRLGFSLPRFPPLVGYPASSIYLLVQWFVNSHFLYADRLCMSMGFGRHLSVYDVLVYFWSLHCECHHEIFILPTLKMAGPMKIRENYLHWPIGLCALFVDSMDPKWPSAAIYWLLFAIHGDYYYFIRSRAIVTSNCRYKRATT